ncbi:MAG: PTS fructose transporter subunit IIBC, partial [Bacillota bacterium]
MAKLKRNKKSNPLEEARKALMTGISYIIPLVVAGGMILSLALIFGDAQTEGTIANEYRKFGGSILGLMVPVLAGYIAYGLESKA